MDDNKEKLTAKFAKMDQNFFNPVCLWHIQQTTIAYFVYWPAQSLTKINYCCSTRVFYWTIKAANICSGILLLSFLAFQLFGPPKCLWSSYHGSRGSRISRTGPTHSPSEIMSDNYLLVKCPLSRCSSLLSHDNKCLASFWAMQSQSTLFSI